MLDFDKNQFCVGCAGCRCACPREAIRMGESENGFYCPSIIPEKCVACGLCEKVCPVLGDRGEPRDVGSLQCEYAYQLNDTIRMASTSGGIFYALASETIRRGGAVCGCVWDEGYVARHVLTDDIETVQGMRGSKYVQSDMGHCYEEIKRAVSMRQVLFAGTPCQATALTHYVGDHDNLLTCAVICGGVPSPKVWRKYKEALEAGMDSKMSDIQMRSKETNWYVPEIKAAFENGRVAREILLTENLYGTNFGLGLTISEACMRCKYKLDTMKADLLIGDHWGINPRMLKQSKNKGASAVVFLTDKGKAAFGTISRDVYAERGSIHEVVDSHAVMMKHHRENNRRADFFANLDTEEIIPLLDRCLPENTRRRMLRTKRLHRFRLYIPLFTFRWKHTYERKQVATKRSV